MPPRFDSVSEYLFALETDSGLAVVSVPMAAAALNRTRAGVLQMLRSDKLQEVVIAGARCVRAGSVAALLREDIKLTAQVRRELEELAAQRGLICYEPLMETVGLTNTPPNRRKIGGVLDGLSRRSFAEHGFLISTLVCRSVNGQPTLPGEGYWPVASELLKRPVTTPDDRRNVFDHQLRAIYRYFAAR